MTEDHRSVIDLQAYRIRRLSDLELQSSISDTAAFLAEQPPDAAADEHAYLEQLLVAFRAREMGKSTLP